MLPFGGGRRKRLLSEETNRLHLQRHGEDDYNTKRPSRLDDLAFGIIVYRLAELYTRLSLLSACVLRVL